MGMFKPCAARTQCADGFSLSIQASRFHYCTPRDDEGPHSEVEVGFIRDADDKPAAPPETWREFADGDFPNDVYGYVPMWLVESFIAEHGGRKA